MTFYFYYSNFLQQVNHSKLKTKHTARTKSFARIRDELVNRPFYLIITYFVCNYINIDAFVYLQQSNDPEGKELDMITIFTITHKKRWPVY